MDVQDIKLKKGFVLIDAEPVIVEEMINGIHRSPTDIEMERARRIFRVGRIVLVGREAIEEGVTHLTSSSLKGKLTKTNGCSSEIEENIPTETRLLKAGDAVVFDGRTADIFDLPVEGIKHAPILLNIHYLIGLIDENEESPS